MSPWHDERLGRKLYKWTFVLNSSDLISCPAYNKNLSPYQKSLIKVYKSLVLKNSIRYLEKLKLTYNLPNTNIYNIGIILTLQALCPGGSQLIINFKNQQQSPDSAVRAINIFSKSNSFLSPALSAVTQSKFSGLFCSNLHRRW